MRTTEMYKKILIGLLSGSLCASCPAQTTAADWKNLREKFSTLGLPANRAEQTLEQCRKKGMSPAATASLLQPVYTAHIEALPIEGVLLKIEEGLAKQVDARRLTAAAQARLYRLRQADNLVSSGRQERGGGHDHLIMHTCMALESGLPEKVLEKMFSRPGGFRYGRMTHAIEAGEILQLAGLRSEDTEKIMTDLLDRNLNGAETARVIDIILTGHREGKSFQSIHARLWVSEK